MKYKFGQGKTPQAIFDDLTSLLRNAEVYADQNRYQRALDIYAQVIDAYLASDEAVLASLFERASAEVLPQLDMLLAEVSSLIISKPHLSEASDPSACIASSTPVPVTLSPLLTPKVRCSWLERLFALWLKCINTHQIREQVQEIIFEVAWSEDIPFLRNLVESELQHASPDTQSRTLEHFLKELPQKEPGTS